MSESKALMQQPLFEIENLKCAYPSKEDKKVPGKTVLEVNKLSIPRGKIIVLLGLSGSGKSTLLETLGLMTKTIQPDSKVLFYPNGKESKLDYLELWKDGEEPSRTKVRMENLNFIFQDTNLMPNFSNVDNVSLAELIDGKVNIDVARAKSKATLKSMGLPGISFEKCPKNISGGERQRVAFARAIQPDFTVLFGDEPTGNLDDNNAVELMKKIKEAIHPVEPVENQNKTAIIVSHNIHLAIEFADEIVVLTRNNNHFTIVKDNIFIKDGENDWHKEIEKGKIDNSVLFVTIKQIMDNAHKNHNSEANKPILVKSNLLVTIIGLLCVINNNLLRKVFNSFNIAKEFTKLFFSKESSEFLGKKNKNFVYFFIILTIVYIVIGLANGALKDLKDKMDDPFVNSIEVEQKGRDYSINNGVNVRDFLFSLLQSSAKTDYNIDTIYEFNRFPFSVRYADHPTDLTIAWSRSIIYTDPVLKKVTDSLTNCTFGRCFADENDYGVIVTSDFLKKSHYREDAPWIFTTVEFDGASRNIPIPVKAIVNKLPGSKECDLIMLQNLYNNFNNFDEPFLIKFEQILFLLANIKNEHQELFTSVLNQSLKEIGLNSTDFEVKFATYKKAYKDIIYYSINPTIGFSRLEEEEDLYKKLMNSASVKEFKIKNNYKDDDFTQIYGENYNYNISSENVEYDEIAIILKNTSKINEFVQDFENNTKIQVDMGKVENMNIFHWISTRTNILLFILIGLSVYAILQYLGNILNFLLFKIRKNIGTLKAFGIDVQSIYQTIMLTFILSGIILSLIFSGLIGFLVLDYMGLAGFAFFYESKVYLLGMIFTIPAWLFFILPIIATFFGGWIVFQSSKKKYFNQAPGDLIFDRI